MLAVITTPVCFGAFSNCSEDTEFIPCWNCCTDTELDSNDIGDITLPLSRQTQEGR
jgi:hypothetical protein